MGFWKKGPSGFVPMRKQMVKMNERSSCQKVSAKVPEKDFKCVSISGVSALSNIVRARLSGGTPWRYDGKASCMSKQTVILVLEKIFNALSHAHVTPQHVTFD